LIDKVKVMGHNNCGEKRIFINDVKRNLTKKEKTM
jgi:carbonic anhydrase